MNKRIEAIYSQDGKWFWKDPSNGEIHGPYKTRNEARTMRTQIRKDRSEDVEHKQSAAA